MRFSKKTSQKTLKMRDSLFGYMMILTVVILIVIALGMVILGTFAEPSEHFSSILGLQMDVFERELSSQREELAIRGTRLSIAASDTIESFTDENEISFDDIEDSPEFISEIQHRLIGTLSTELLKAECSGAFILLDTTVNNNAENARFSRSGIYLRRASGSILDDSLKLFRGNSSVGKEHGLVSHGKWQLEFDTKAFPDYDGKISAASDTAEETAFLFTDFVTMPGTDEKAVLISIPIRLQNGRVIGLCGFEISDVAFKANYSQSATIENLTCMWVPEGDYIDTGAALLCSTDGSRYIPPSEILEIVENDDGLMEFRGEELSYIGNFRKLPSGTIAVMIPKSDYDNAVAKNMLQIIIFLILLCFFAISLCRILSKRFIAPIVKGLEQIRYYEHADSASRFSEIDDLFTFLADKDRELEHAYETLNEEKQRAENELTRVQAQIEKLAYSRKSEIDPDDYENFLLGIKTLTKSERNIFEMYLDGKSAKDIIEITGIKESTLKFHNSNIYEKLGVSSRKQMLMYAALYTKSRSDKE